MKKVLMIGFTLCFVQLLMVGCGSQNNMTSQEISNKVQEPSNQNDNLSYELKCKAFALAKSLSSYARAMKLKNEKCDRTMEGVAKCYSKYFPYAELQPDNSLLVKFHDGTSKINFVVDNNCSTHGDCKAIRDKGMDSEVSVYFSFGRNGDIEVEIPNQP